jgi:hypothetical protein
LRELLERQQWLAREYQPIALSTLLPEVKLRQFALEAKSLDAARMLEMSPPKRYTLAATLIELQNARVLDDLAEMFIKRMLRIHRHGREALALDRLKHQERTDGLIHKLPEVIVAWRTEGNAEERLQAIGTVLAPDSCMLLEQCEAHQAQTGNNYYVYVALLSGPSFYSAAHLARSEIPLNDPGHIARTSPRSCSGERNQPCGMALLVGAVERS